MRLPATQGVLPTYGEVALDERPEPWAVFAGDRRISGPFIQRLPACLSSNQNWLEERRYTLSICADRRCSASAKAVWLLVAITGNAVASLVL